MSGPSITGGGGISLDDVMVFLWGNSKTGATTAGGSGLRYSQSTSNTEVT